MKCILFLLEFLFFKTKIVAAAAIIMDVKTTTMNTVTSTEAVTTEEVSESGRTETTDWVVGILMMVVSFVCGLAYFVILRTIWKDNELKRMPSYRFMFFLGVFDIAQCFPHFVTGIFTCFQTVFHPLFAKAMGVIATPCYVAYAVLTIFLSFNRLVQLSSPTFDRILFGDNRWLIWVSLSGLFFLGFALALASPWATIRYIPDWYSWDYDYDMEYSHYVQRVEMYIEIGGIFVSAFFYLLIIHQLIKTKKRFMISSSHSAEIKVLIQATAITVYCTILNVLWHNYKVLLPENLWSYTGLNFMWIFNSGVYPLIYFIVNKALRDRISVKKLSTPLGGASLWIKSKVEKSKSDTPGA